MTRRGSPRNSVRRALLGIIPFDTRIALADRTQRALLDLGEEDLLLPYRGILQRLVERYESPTTREIRDYRRKK